MPLYEYQPLSNISFFLWIISWQIYIWIYNIFANRWQKFNGTCLFYVTHNYLTAWLPSHLYYYSFEIFPNLISKILITINEITKDNPEYIKIWVPKITFWLEMLLPLTKIINNPIITNNIEMIIGIKNNLFLKNVDADIPIEIKEINILTKHTIYTNYQHLSIS